ncbi:cytochrome P450 [Phlyctema vagabunda]|uniref:Cytochrome P450 n=1 Tax=Phlyctema vagabunda TaxID=108571 RepID=A0ABR4P9Z4_9HELO
MGLAELPLPSLPVIGALLALYLVGGAIYRLYFSPVAQFPGPRIAALTYWYEFYHDVVRRGQYTFEIKRMHEKYGPIVRINPCELHVATPSFYDEIYAGGGRRRDKWEWFTNQFGIPESVFATVAHGTHRMRRTALNPFFSVASVRRLQPMIEERLDAFLGRFRDFQESGEVMTINLAFAAFTNDVVMQYAFARSDHRLEAPDFDPSFHDASVVGSTMGHLTKQITWILPLMQSMPDWVTIRLNANMASYVKLQRDIHKQIAEIQSSSFDGHKQVSHGTIFHEILNSKLPDSEKTPTRLWQDGQVTVIAGTLTTAWALSVITYHLLTVPDVLRKLKDELAAAIPDPTRSTPVATLEQLPYLAACVQEGLRLSCGVSSRLQRIAPDEDLLFNDGTKQWTIPRGTPVGMTSTLLHYEPSVFPDPHAFRPERFVENPRLDRYLVAFSKGSRHCIGINLAYAELYLALASIFRSYGSKSVHSATDSGYLELFETDLKDVAIAADGITPLVVPESKGVRVRVMK